MTVSKQKSKKVKKIIIVFSFALIIFTLSNIFIYNKIVNFQHLVAAQTKSLEDLKLADANLKNQLYEILDLKNLSGLAKSLGMVKVNNESVSFYSISN